jgi:hypothetical protein
LRKRQLQCQFCCHPELISGSHEMLKQVQHDILIAGLRCIDKRLYTIQMKLSNIDHHRSIKDKNVALFPSDDYLVERFSCSLSRFLSRMA